MEQRDRTVVIPRFLADELAGPIDGDGLIFTSPDRHPLRSPNFLQRVGVRLWPTANWEIWCLTTFDIPRLRCQYQQEKAVQRMLGHASAQVTLDRYSHLNDDDLEVLADSMDPRYGAAQT